MNDIERVWWFEGSSKIESRVGRGVEQNCDIESRVGRWVEQTFFLENSWQRLSYFIQKKAKNEKWVYSCIFLSCFTLLYG